MTYYAKKKRNQWERDRERGRERERERGRERERVREKEFVRSFISQSEHPLAFVSKALISPHHLGLSTNWERESVSYSHGSRSLVFLLNWGWVHNSHWSSQLGPPGRLEAYHSLAAKIKPWPKLLGLCYRICYKQGQHNQVVVALSPISSDQLLALSVLQPTWLQTISDQHVQHDATASLFCELYQYALLEAIQSKMAWFCIEIVYVF
jgi:hypothetical protein